jgi:hypothetical protein
MKAYWTPLIFAAGIGAGWLMFSGDMRSSAESADNKSAASVVRKREARPAISSHEAKFRSFAKDLPKLNVEEQWAFQKSLAPADRAAAVEALLAQAGPNGISTDAKGIIRGLLFKSADEDFDGAWAWCQRIESDPNRQFVASQLIEGLAKKDRDRALALHLEMAAEDPEFGSYVPFEILKQAVTKDAAAFLDLIGKVPFRKTGSSGTLMDFATDFDFQQAAEGLTVLKKNNVEKSPAVFPTNFLSTWAARDADAAYAWYSKNPSGSTFESFDSLLDGIEKQSPGTSTVWAADKLSQPGDERDAMIRSLSQHSSDNSTVINSIAQAMPDTSSRDRFLGDVVTTSCMNDTIAAFGYAITQQSSPSARLETLQQLTNKNRLTAAKIPDAQLQQWGLTRQQVEQLQPSSR